MARFRKAAAAVTRAPVIFPKHVDQRLYSTFLGNSNLVSRMINGKTAQRGTSCNTHPFHAVVQHSNKQWYSTSSSDASLVVCVAGGKPPQGACDNYASAC